MTMTNNTIKEMSDFEIAAVNGGVSTITSTPRFAVDDVVEVTCPIYHGWTNRGRITNVKQMGDTWAYYIKFYDWFMPNGWRKESFIASKVGRW